MFVVSAYQTLEKLKHQPPRQTLRPHLQEIGLTLFVFPRLEHFCRLGIYRALIVVNRRKLRST